MTQKGLVKLCQTWQKRLRLQDWNIVIGFAEMQDTDIYGGCNTKINFQEAEIGINCKLTNPRDIEETLVHELMHIRFPHCQKGFHLMFDPEALVGQEFEVGIDMISRALVEAYGE